MSCKLVKLSYVSDLNSVKRTLLLSSSITTNEEKDEGNFNLWNDIAQKEDRKDDETWINDCLVALSPALDVMIFALKHRAVFLTSKWFASDDSDVKLKFSMTYGDSLVRENEDEITSVLCLPIASHKRSLQGNADWTCVIVGFATGCVRMYTEKAELLLSQHLHNGRIIKIKCHTYSALRSHFLSDNQAEELLIIYNSAVVSVDGFSLYQTLRACRNQLARTTAGNWETVKAPPLTYKKWSFQENNKVVDCESIGTITTQPFDSLATHSLRSGFYLSARSRFLAANLYITVGSGPYIGFYHAVEGSSELLLSDVAHAVASRLKTFFKNTAAGGLLGWSQQTDKIEFPTTIPLRYGLFDRTRHGISISTSPNKLLAVVTDTFGRVVMYDIQKGIAVRVWKGYRDAQCGWIQVEDSEENEVNSQKQTPKRAFFLIIYAPRRGIVEVWASQQGPRVAAFNVGKSCKLVSPGHTMMGLNMIIARNVKLHMYPCLLLDADGGVFTVSIPFHCALSDKNSKSARDMHLLKEFKSMLRSSTKGNSKFVGDIAKLLLDMKTANVRQQALDSLLICNSVTADAVKEVVSELLEHLKSQNFEQLDYESKLLLQTCCRIKTLILTYTSICKLNENALPDFNDDKIADIQLVSEKLNITETEVGRILSLTMLFHSVNYSRQKRVRFVDVDKGNVEMTFSSFVRTFIVNENHLIKMGDNVATSLLTVSMNPTATEEQLASTGEFIFGFCIQCSKLLPILEEIVAGSQIAVNTLIVILLQYWLLSEDIGNKSREWVNFQLILKYLCTCESSRSAEGEVSHTLPIDNIKHLFSQSMNNIAAYLCAIVTRSVCIEMMPSFHTEPKQCITDENASNEEILNDKIEEKEASDESEWETISLDVEQWSLLVKQLEDVLILSILLKCRPSNKIQLSNKKCNISLACLQNGGPGIMTDLVAAWCVDVGIGPDVLNTYSADRDIYTCIPDKLEQGALDDKIQSFSLIKGLLGQIQKRFPRSMDPDALLANCSWEHMVHWDKNHDIVRHLRSAIHCLSLVVSAILRSGVACMMWKTFVHKRFESLALLIEKVGKTPKDRLCRRDVEMSDAYLAHFVDFCCQLLEVLLESNVISEIESIPMFPAEEMWRRNDVHGPAPFVTLALKQQNPNYALIHHHLLLANSLLFIIVFDQKNVHPLSLYDTRGKSAFFKELHCNVIIPIKGLDTELVALRKQFLQSVATAVVRNITSVSENDTHNIIVSTTMGDIEASKWFNRILDLARGWDVDLDEVRRHYVCELYNCGHDTFAEEARSSVTDNVVLASQLLLLAGERVQYVLSDAEQSVKKLARLSPSLSIWLKTLPKPHCCSVPLSVTAVLLTYVVNFLPENQKEYQLALLLMEAVNDLIDMQATK